MELYIISGLSIIVFLFLIGLCVQLIRMEKSIKDLSFFIEEKVEKLFRPEE